MLRSIILGVLCFAATTLAADVCTLQCKDVSGRNWTGDTSVVVKLDGSTEIIYDSDLKVFAVVNVKDSLVIGIKGHFLIIVNIRTGGYLLIDLQTQFAVYGKIAINFLDSNGSIRYSVLTAQLNVLLTKYTAINPTTPGCFNFSAIVASYYRFQFDFTVIYSGQIELTGFLSFHFTGWFQLVQTQIRSGTISASRGIWGLMCVVMETQIDISFSIFQVIYSSVLTFGEIEVKIVQRLVRIISFNITYVIEFAIKLIDISSTGIANTVDEFIELVNDITTKPAGINITIAGTRLEVLVTRIRKVYVLRFTFTPRRGDKIDVKIIFTNSVLFITNEVTKITVAFYQRSFLSINATTDQVLLFQWSFLSIKGAITTDAKLVEYINCERYAQAAKLVIKIVRNTKVRYNCGNLQHAVLSGSVSQTATIVGSRESAQTIITYYGVFFQGSSGGSLGGFSTGVFEARENIVVGGISVIINGIAASGGNWATFGSVFAGGSYKLFSG